MRAQGSLDPVQNNHRRQGVFSGKLRALQQPGCEASVDRFALIRDRESGRERQREAEQTWHIQSPGRMSMPPPPLLSSIGKRGLSEAHARTDTDTDTDTHTQTHRERSREREKQREREGREGRHLDGVPPVMLTTAAAPIPIPPDQFAARGVISEQSS